MLHVLAGVAISGTAARRRVNGTGATHPISDSPMVSPFRPKITPVGPPVAPETACKSESSKWWPGTDKFAGSEFGHAQHARRARATEGPSPSTIDTRIFNTTGRPVRCEQVKDRRGISRWPTEPLRSTEPVPNRIPEDRLSFLECPNTVNGLPASRPNSFRTERNGSSVSRSADSPTCSRGRHGRQKIGATIAVSARGRTRVSNDLASVVDSARLSQRRRQRLDEVVQVVHPAIDI